ncbi:MAG: hypothetical protein QG600_774 [Patescibacteria group bacterium]|nr:hypothetical protein [Patescibacteria group bacterium]
MQERIHEDVSVITVYDHTKRRVLPWRLKWHGRTYTITQIGLHYTLSEGSTLYHLFSVSDGSMFFRLKLNTQTLHWRLEEVSDGNVL